MDQSIYIVSYRDFFYVVVVVFVAQVENLKHYLSLFTLTLGVIINNLQANIDLYRFLIQFIIMIINSMILFEFSILRFAWFKNKQTTF